MTSDAVSGIMFEIGRDVCGRCQVISGGCVAATVTITITTLAPHAPCAQHSRLPDGVLDACDI